MRPIYARLEGLPVIEPISTACGGFLLGWICRECVERRLRRWPKDKYQIALEYLDRQLKRQKRRERYERFLAFVVSSLFPWLFCDDEPQEGANPRHHRQTNDRA